MKFWLVEALELSKRRAVLFLVLGLITMGLEAIDASGMVVISLFPMVLSLGCIVAKSADDSESLFKVIVEVAPRAWARVFIIGFTPCIALIMATLLIEMISPGNLGALLNHMEPSQIVSATKTSIGFGILLVIGTSVIGLTLWITSYLWFLWTLIVIGELPFFEAINQSFEGFFINKFVVWPYAISVFLLLLVLLLPMIFIPWLAIVTSMMYVSFRDVWLGRKDNNPAIVNLAEPVLKSAT